eukprot:4560797-Lingulodinium_polyedra.AAC.1
MPNCIRNAGAAGGAPQRPSTPRPPNWGPCPCLNLRSPLFLALSARTLAHNPLRKEVWKKTGRGRGGWRPVEGL